MRNDINSHRDLMVSLAQRNGWQRGAELGLGKGMLFRRFLAQVPGLYMIGVDIGIKPARRESVEQIAAQYSGRCTVHFTSTNDAAPLVENASLDFVFIDAGHSYGAVRDDIRYWWPKLKPGGWFGGHDFDPSRHPGVVRAVNEAFPIERGKRQLLGHTVWRGLP